MIYYIGNDLFAEFERCTPNEIKFTPLIAIDIETKRKYKKNLYREDVYVPGLDPFFSSICMVQIYNGEDTYIIDARTTDLTFLKAPLTDPNIKKIGHNLQFESKFFLVHLGVRMVNVWDTMIAEKILYNGSIRSYSLEQLMKDYLGLKTSSLTLFDKSFEVEIEKEVRRIQSENILFGTETVNAYDEAYETVAQARIDKSTRLGFVEIGDRPFTSKEILYGANDVEKPYLIYLEQIKGRRIPKRHGYDETFIYNPVKSFELEMELVPLLAEISMEGIYINKKKWLTIYETNLAIYLSYKMEIDNWVIENYPAFRGSSDLFSNGATCAINWESSKQVIDFFKHAGTCPIEYSKAKKKKEFTVGAKAVFNLLTKDQKDDFLKGKFPEIVDFQSFILAYLLLKKYGQLTTTFGKEFLRFEHPITKKIHSNYNQYMNTGRMSSTSPNMTNIPRGAAWRECFYTDTKIINADFSAQESRVLADLSQVPNLVKFFTEGDSTHGDDLHSFIATMMYREISGDKSLIITKKTNPTERDNAKTLNFAMVYGASAFSIMHKLSVTEEAAQQFIEVWYDSQPGLRQFSEDCKKQGLDKRYIELSPLGNLYFFYASDEMDRISEKAWKLAPDNYRSLKPEEREVIKDTLRKTTNWSSLWREHGMLSGQLERKSQNYRIQGFAAVQTKKAIIAIRKAGIKIINVVHDEILGKYEREGDDKLLQETMEKAAFSINQCVPMKAEAVLGDCWMH